VKVVVDCRYVRLGRHDGISRFTASLVAELAQRHPLTMLISDERQLEKLPELPWALGPSTTGIGELFTARTVNRLRPDVVFSPMQTMGSLGRRYRLILTLHDLIYYSARTPPRDLNPLIRALWRLYHLAWWPQRLMLNRADAVVTVSETTRQAMLRRRLTRRPITVVPNAAGLPHGGQPRPVPEGRELVYMGSFMPYKNVEVIAAALHELPGYRLHLMSAIGPRDRERLAAAAPAGSLVFHDGASDEEYAAALRSATALVTASQAEGFGIPVIEAMSVGTPAVVSDIPIFREICGEAAVYFPVRDAGGLARAIRGLAEEPGEWQRRSALALRQAERFSWASSAQRLLELMRSLAEA